VPGAALVVADEHPVLIVVLIKEFTPPEVQHYVRLPGQIGGQDGGGERVDAVASMTSRVNGVDLTLLSSPHSQS
jgi:hypothetical protein